jgi:hypothetical protein
MYFHALPIIRVDAGAREPKMQPGRRRSHCRFDGAPRRTRMKSWAEKNSI